MGNSQSSRASTKTKAPSKEVNWSSEIARGRKSTESDETVTTHDLNTAEVHLEESNDHDSDTDSFDSEDDTEDEFDEEWNERYQILADAMMLKQYASFHLHPENPVFTSDPYAKARNYFSRASAPEELSVEESDEQARILEEAKQLKTFASFYLHPECPVVATDSTACARNYFTRASAPEQVSYKDAEDRAAILEEAALLKKHAEFHLHPEKPVGQQVDATAFGRNYYSRYSAPEQISCEDAEERALIFEEIALLKKHAEFHLHPEKPVLSADAMACGRNYFTRASASEYLDAEEEQEREKILADAAMMKQFATFHLHPEMPVAVTDSMACARNFFSRASAPEQVSHEDAEERAAILEEAALLKKHAEFHLHPEKPVGHQVDPTAFGRNYYSRYSAPEQISCEDAEERALIFEEIALLKKHAEFHLHPEKPVESTDAMACGRNYFTRASAPEYLDADEEQEREKILAETAMMKQFATFHLHPEMPVAVTDSMACARNYFSRASAPEQVSYEDAEERAAILEEVALLKKHAEFHLHPEKPVGQEVDATTFGRNYFFRYSAPEQISLADAEERALIFQEIALLKKHAEFHLHPEKPVESTDAMACGRNYFTRASASEYLDAEEEQVREKILAETAMMKQFATFHLHPEMPVVVTDSMACARNYFTRASAPEQMSYEDAEERAAILEEVALLKKHAEFHLHPEKPVGQQVDPTAFGRNYYSRDSAPEQISCEDAEERALIFEEIALLKKHAEFHLHPEKPVESTDARARGRNYFTRASAPEFLDAEEEQERAKVMADVVALKQFAAFHLHPELPVKTSDRFAFGRCYFTRPAGLLHDPLITSEGREVCGTEHDSSYADDFHFDEELTDFEDFRASLTKVISQRLAGSDYFMPLHHEDGNQNESFDEENEGKLSRSPSSIMLFGYEGTNAY